ncbi:MAG: HAMP domain-containing protein [Silicimonas sp.]|nr:HAMP domain-containing protein [Silicimonas sp.]
MKRVLPTGLTGQLILLLTVALLLANAVALVLLASERDRLGRAAREEGAVARILALAPLLDGIDREERVRRISAADQRGTRIEVASDPIVPPNAAGSRAQALAALFAPSLGGRELRLADGADRNTLAISVALNTPDDWLNAVLRLGSPPRRTNSIEALALVLGLSLAAVLGGALIFLRRLTKPLAELAQAARAAGRGDRSARVAEDGAREFQEAAHAFNDMQARIARFDAERTRTLAAVGHDLRTPITSLRIRAEMLSDQDAEPMIATLEEMRVMADSLVAFARGGENTEEPQPVDLAKLVQRLAAERGAELAVVMPTEIIGQPVALSRAIGNLIDNAMRYAGAARVTLDRTGKDAVVTIEDDGPGIPAEQLDEVQEPFVRGEGSRSLDTGGAGLGLSIARAVAQGHGGNLELSIRESGGLRAKLRLPIVEG